MKAKFRVVSLLLTLSLLLCTFSVTAFADESTVLLGDVDGNGKVDTQDARAILRMASCIDAPDLSVADMNSDGIISLDDVMEALTKASNVGGNVGGVEIPDANGENFLSDSASNEFIKLVSQKFGVDSKSLVAIYSVPDSGTNYVLQFKKSLIGSTYKKSPDNLERVYHIGVAPQREISYTNGKLLLGDHYNCEAAEGVLVFNLVKTSVMEQYPNYFEGV